MRLEETSIGRLHGDLASDVDDHHAAPVSVSMSNTSQVIAAGADYNLDTALGKTGLTFARVQLMGPAITGFGATQWRECASVQATTSASDAIGHTVRNTGSNYLVYSATYAKALGVTNLTHKIFDTFTATGSRYIALKDAIITGSTLRLTFHNYDGSAKTLWVKGSAVVW